MAPETLVFWLDGSTALHFKTTFQRIIDGEVMNLEGIKNLLESNSYPPWLMIIDNADIDTFFGDDQLSKLLPRSSHGCIIIISRNRSLASKFSLSSEVIEMHGMELDDARNLFRSYTPIDPDDNEDADELLAALGYLPIAIVQAGLVMSSHPMSAREYLSHLINDRTASRLILAGLRLYHDTNQASPPTTAPVISLSDIQSQSPEAVRILVAMACLDSRNIPAIILRSLGKPHQISHAMAVLQAYSAFTYDQSTDTLGLNPFVRALIRSHLKTIPWFLHCIMSLLDLLDFLFPTDLKCQDTICKARYYSSHVVSLLSTLVGLCGEYQLPSKCLTTSISLATNVSYLLRDMAAYDQVKSLMREMIQLRPNVFSDAAVLAPLLNHLAAAEHCMGRYDIAAQIGKQVLVAQPSHPGLYSIEAIRSLNTLALVCQSQGKLKDAEHYHLRVWDMKIRALGSNHPDILTTISNFGRCLQAQGRHKDAEARFHRVLIARSKIFEADHPSVLRSMNNLGVSLQHQKRFPEAEKWFRKALLGRRRVLGDDHHETLRNESNLAAVLHYQTKLDQAEEIFRQVAIGFARKLGSEHPETIQAYQNLGSLLRDKARYQEAEEVISSLLPIVRKVYGERHLMTLNTLKHLAIVLEWQKKYVKALSVAHHIRDVRSEKLGKKHPDTQASQKQVQQLEDYVKTRSHVENDLQVSLPLCDDLCASFQGNEKVPPTNRRALLKHCPRPKLYQYLPMLIAIPHALGLGITFAIYAVRLLYE
jgi:tetratricopeptide (TPR) repeat protein